MNFTNEQSMRYRVDAQCVALDECVQYVALDAHRCVDGHVPNDDQRDDVQNDVDARSDADSERLHSSQPN